MFYDCFFNMENENFEYNLQGVEINFLEEDCIICLVNSNTLENPLRKGSEIYDCSCNYNVHIKCIQNWNEVKKQQICLQCNKIKQIKEETEINLNRKLLQIIAVSFCIMITIIYVCKKIKIEEKNNE